MNKEDHKKSLKVALSSALAVVTAAVVAFTSMAPTTVLAVSDNSSLDNYKSAIGEITSPTSTKNVGRVWSDKTVLEGSSTVDGYTYDLANDENFNVVYSAMSSSARIQGQQASALDVVFILDTSGSMKKETSDGKSRISAAIEALNHSLDMLVNDNPNNRVGVATFATESSVLMPLNHYESQSKEAWTEVVHHDAIYFLGHKIKDAWDETIYHPARKGNFISFKDDKVEANWTGGSKSVDFAGGTNTQLGFKTGMDMLLNEPSTTVNVNGKEVQRIPVVVLLSDGASTYSVKDPNWWDPSGKKQGPGNVAYYGNGMKAMMTAAYKKQAINAHYGVPNTAIYTIGLGVGDLNGDEKDLAQVTLNPTKHWDDSSKNINDKIREDWKTYSGGEKVKVTVEDGKTFEITHPKSGDISSLKYEDGYFETSNAAELDDVFKKIVSDIIAAKPTYPTEIQGTQDPTQGGYITYTDPIGEYMEVKDVKSVIYNGQEFTITLAPTVTTAGDIETRTWTAQGTVADVVSGKRVSVSGIKISVTGNIKSNERNNVMTIQVPAALIPLKIYDVQLDVDGNVVSNTLAQSPTPLRVVYSVGLVKDVDQLTGVADTYIENNLEEGKVNFYCNQFEKNAKKGNAVTRFTPSRENANYYFQEDTVIYKDAELKTPVKENEDFVNEASYYIATPYYDGPQVKYATVTRSGAQMNTTPAERLKVVDGNKALKAGVPRTFHIKEDLAIEKPANTTGTATHLYVSEIESMTGDTIHTLSFAHGNNGKLQVEAAKDLVISKKVIAPEGITAPEGTVFKFDVTMPSKQGRTITAKFKDASGKVTDKKIVFDGTGKTVVELKDKESLSIPFAVGTYTVTEQTPPKGFTVKVPANAKGEVGYEKNAEVEFVNEYKVEPFVADQTQFGFPMTKTLSGKKFENSDQFTFKIEGTEALPENTEVTIKGSDKGVLGKNTANADFGKFTFTKPGSYVYIISEVPGTTAGIDYDAARYKLTVNITDKGDGTLLQESVTLEKETTPNNFVAVPEGSKISFTNTFKAESANVNITGNKVLKNGKFSNYNAPFKFKLEAKTTEAPMPDSDIATASPIDGSILFGKIKFETVHVGKTYEYIVRELQPTKDGTYNGEGLAGAKKDAQGNWVYHGITFDKSEKTISVEVKAEEQENKSLVVPTVTGNNFTFNNVYNAEKIFYFTKVQGSAYGVKEIAGRPFVQGDKFTFEVTSPNDGIQDHQLPAEIVIAPEEGNSFRFDFGQVKFTQADAGKEFTYIFKERNDRMGGITYDEAERKVTLSVKDNYDGTLTITKSGDELIWKNTYSSKFDDAYAITLEGTKHYKDITGGQLTDGMFAFNVTPLDNAPANGVISTTNVTKDGVFTYFENLKFTFEDMQGAAEKKFVYEVKEFIPETPKPGMTYDCSVYHVSVKVVDDMKGNLSVPSDGIEITKQEKPGAAFKKVQNVEFTNEYKPKEDIVIPFETNGRPMLSKQLAGYRKDALKENEFSFSFKEKSLEPADGVVIKNQGAVGNKADGTVDFSESLLTFKKPGKYVFTITEDTSGLPKDGVTNKVSEIEITYIVEDVKGELVATLIYSGISENGVFVNEYNAKGSLAAENLEVTKRISGRDWKADDVFTFTLSANNVETQIAINKGFAKLTKDTVEIKDSTADYKAQFGNIEFTVPGNFEFKVSETAIGLQPGIHADTIDRVVKVTVTDNSDGTLTAELTEVTNAKGEESSLTFVNKYEPKEVILPGDGNLTVHKDLNRDWLDTDSFTFTLSAGNKATEVALGTDVILGSDTSAKQITIINKSVNKEEHFADITFKKDGQYVFNVTEADPNISNVDYVKESRKIIVDVTLNKDGSLSAKLNDKSESLSFKNVYTPTPADLVGETDLVVTKSIANRDWLEGETFTFEIKAANDAAKETDAVQMPAETKITVSKDVPTNHFGNITFKKAGHYEFTVTEKLPDGVKNGTNGLSYDLTPRNVVVDVVDNLDGTLTITKDSLLSEKLDFVNQYKPSPLSYDGKTNLQVKKLIDGRNWQAGDAFTFVLNYDHQDQSTVDAYKAHAFELPENAHGVTIEYKEGTKAEDYVTNFGDIIFNKAGTYKFVVQEVQGTLGGITYDTSAKGFTVTVTDNGKGKLKATSNDVITITNVYTTKPVVFPAEGKGDLQVTKQFTGRPGNQWKDTDSFTFHMRPSKDYGKDSFKLGSTECTITGADSNKVASFGDITFYKPGKYEFIIQEVIPTEKIPGVQYTDWQARVTVNVWDDGQGQLHATVDTERTDYLIFKNQYNPSELVVDPTEDPSIVEDKFGIKLNKNLIGREWKEGDSFSFEIKPLENAPKPQNSKCTVTKPNQKFDFGTITFTTDDMNGAEQKEFRYEVTEMVPESKIPGITYETKSIIFKITVKDNGKGSLVTSGFVQNVEDCSNVGEFKNEYVPSETKLDGDKNLKVVKNFTGRSKDEWLPTDEFTFQLIITDSETSKAQQEGNVILPDNANGITIKSSDSIKEKAFGDIQFKSAGTYKFRIVEVEQKIPGVKYAAAQDIVISVVDNQNGKLVASVVEGNELKPFANVYEPDSVTLSGHDNLNVVKEITGRDWIGTDSFTFTIEANNQKTSDAIANELIIMPEANEVTITIDDTTVGHTKHFGDITFKEAGLYEFKVTEKAPEGVEPDKNGIVKVDGVDYDTKPQVIKVTVTDEGKGSLSAVADTQELKFVNKYTHGTTTLRGETNLIVRKEIIGRSMQEGDVFEFEMTAGNELAETVKLPENIKVQYPVENNSAFFSDITFKKPGKYEFNIREVIPEIPNPSIGYNTEVKKVIVTVTDDLQGKLHAKVDHKETVIKNTYTPTEVVLNGKENLKVQKELSGRPWQPGDIFLFSLTGADDATNSEIGKSIVMPANANQISITYEDQDKTEAFGSILFKKAGSYRFKITEKSGSIANVDYDKTERILNVEVYDNKTAGKLEVAITADDNNVYENGTVKFHNTYSPDAVVLTGKENLKVEKQLVGRGWKDGDVFSFTLIPDAEYGLDISMSEPTMVEIAYNEAGNYVANFGDITFTKAGTYKFNIVENVPENSIPGVTYAESQTITVKVTDDYKGHLHAVVDGSRISKFINIYETQPAKLDGKANLQVQKVFNEWNAETSFTFKLAGRNETTRNAIKNKEVVLSKDTVTITKDTKDYTSAFGDITFTKAGSYEFTVEEVVPKNAPDYIQYDTTKKVIDVEVVDDKNGYLVATLSDTEVTSVFTNVYIPNSVQLDGIANLTVTKELQGRDWVQGDTFLFTMSANDEATQKAIQNGSVVVPENFTEISITDTTKPDKKASFGDITFKKAGIYVFKVSEKQGTIPSVAYDEVSRVVTVIVKDNMEGVLRIDSVTVKAEGSYEKDDKNNLVFTNIYTHDAAVLKGSTNLVVSKSISGREWLDEDEFTFELTENEDQEGFTFGETTVTVTKENPFAAFGDITFTKEGTYKFTVKETSKVAGITNAKDQTITVKVVDNHRGKLVATIVEETALKPFVNTYAPEEGTEVDPNPDPDPEKEDPTYPEQTLVGFVKNLEGRNWKEDETFTFELEQTSGPKVDGKNYQESVKVTKDNRKAVFENLTYTPEMMEGKKEQVFTYTVKEVVPSNVDNGLTYDKHVVNINVTVKDMNDGTLKATMTQSGSHVFTNTYNPGEVPVDPTKDPDPEKGDASIGLPFEKVLTGREWKNTDQFQFKLEAITENTPMPEYGKEIATITSPKQKFNFGTITFTAEDMKDAILQEDGITRIQSFSYKVTEIVPEEKDRIPGITYASNEVIFKIDVIDAGTGKLEARVAKTDVNGTTTFENIFEANRIYDDKDGKSGLRIVKTLTGHDMVNGQFTFDVKASNDNAKDKLGKESFKVVTVGDRVAGEPVELTPLTELVFDEKDIDKDFKFEITEQAKPAEGYDGYVYSTEKYEVNIHVEERDGKLIPITTINQGKPIEGSVAKVTFENTFSAEGILNDTKEGSVRIESNKVLVGRDMKENEFKFEVVDKNDSVVATGTNMKDGTITFAEMKFDTKKLVDDAKAEVAGHVMGTNTYTYEYTVREVQPTADKVVMETPAFNITVDVIVNDNGTLDFHVVYPEGTDRLTFVNTYAPTEVELDINGRKTLKTPKGSQMTLEDIAGKFTFNIVSEGADFTPKVIEQPEVVEVEEVVSEELVKDVEEVVEEMTEEVTEEVNEELAEEKVVAEEVVQPMVVDPYGYLPTQQSATNDVAGNVSFGKVRFDVNALNGVEPDEDGKRTITFKYRVDESGSVHGITNAESQHFSIVVADDGNGILDARLVGQSGAFVFENVYSFQPTSSSVTSTIEFTKELTGRNLVDGEFNFMMHEVEGRTEDAIGTNSVDGIVTMSPITFDMPGEYVYVVSELGNTENVFNGVTYDKTVYQVKASVEDNMAGGLNVTWTSLENADVVFKNVYKAKSTEYQFGAMKVLNGREMKGNEFEFVLKDSQERVVDTAKNQKNGTVQFKAIEFKKPGTYTYTLSEVKGHEKHMKYDEGEYKVVLEVTDDGRGQLHVKRLESQDTVVFINTYEKPEDPKKPESPKKDSSDTGLATNASSWMSLMAVSGIALAGISYKKKKNEDK